MLIIAGIDCCKTINYVLQKEEKKKKKKQKKNGKKAKEMDHHTENLRKIRNSDLPEIIKKGVEDKISWDFNEARMEPDVLFSVLEPGVFHRVMDRLQNSGLFEDNIREVVLCYENVAERLFDVEFMLLDMVFPQSMYLNCIRSLIYSTNRPVNETCWYHLLPRQTLCK